MNIDGPVSSKMCKLACAPIQDSNQFQNTHSLLEACHPLIWVVIQSDADTLLCSQKVFIHVAINHSCVAYM